MNNMISVVIPVYNVENYLSKCLDSVVGQTYKNLQIILVDDGSTDNSGRICDEYAVMDNRITVIHQDNKGAGAAKNAGLDLVEGELLSLIDSDDYIEPEFYEKMLSAMKKNNSDVVQCLFANVFVNNRYNRNFNFPSKSNRKLRTKDFLFEMLYDWKYSIFWNKLFKTSLLKDIRFPVGRKIDDEFFTYKLICNAKKVVNINDCLYNYRMRKTSVMNDNYEYNLVLDRIDCFKDRHEYVSAIYSELEYFYYNHFHNILLQSLHKYPESEKISDMLLHFPYKSPNLFQKIFGYLWDKKVKIDCINIDYEVEEYFE